MKNLWSLRIALVLGLGCFLVLGCRGTAPAAQAAERWSQGPAGWLLLSEERRELLSIKTPAEFAAFRELFWARRNPDPSVPENAAADRFFQRVADADRLYGEGDRRGSVTDRGGALILLGSPNILRHRQARVPALGPTKTGNGPRETVRVTEEVWVYFTQDLSPTLKDLVREQHGPVADLAMTFVQEVRSTRITEGKGLLGLARRAWIREKNAELPSPTERGGR